MLFLKMSQVINLHFYSESNASKQIALFLPNGALENQTFHCQFTQKSYKEKIDVS